MKLRKIKLIVGICGLALLSPMCKKTTKGVLEIKHTITISSEENYYRAEVVDDGLYEPNKEFNLGPNVAGYYDHKTAYYWPDESAKNLGYKYRNKGVDNAEEVFYIAGKEGNSRIPGENGHWGSDGGGSGACPQGTWYSPACGDPHGVIWTFGAKTGSFSNKDCNGICDPMIFKFSYEMSGNICSLTYDAVQDIVHCPGYTDSRPPTPKPASITITCSGSELTVSSGNGTQVFTK